jgi:hypothetical protein
MSANSTTPPAAEASPHGADREAVLSAPNLSTLAAAARRAVAQVAALRLAPGELDPAAAAKLRAAEAMLPAVSRRVYGEALAVARGMQSERASRKPPLRQLTFGLLCRHERTEEVPE